MKENQELPSIMVIDDDLHILSLLDIYLSKKGVKTVTCSSAKEALNILRSSQIKLALVDICMPGMTGVELLQHIQKITPSTHVIMITGMGDMEVAKKCMQLGAKDFITKPFDFEYLETSILAELIPLS
ncbi:MAG: response regulator [Victivallales bacterium]